MLVLADGRTATAEDRAPVVAQADTVRFTCLNALAPHVVSCRGSISIFPLTVTVDHARVLSDVEVCEYFRAGSRCRIPLMRR